MRNLIIFLLIIFLCICCNTQNQKAGTWTITSAIENGHKINHKGSLSIGKDGKYWFSINTNGESNFVSNKTTYNGKGGEAYLGSLNTFSIITNQSTLEGVSFKLVSLSNNEMKLKSDIIGINIEYVLTKD